jgi:hypothetical protein
VAVADDWSADPAGAAEGLELGQGPAQHRRGGAGGAKEVELVAARGRSRGGERSSLDGGRGRARLEGERGEAHQDEGIEGGGCDADAPRVALATLEIQIEVEIPAGECATLQSGDQAGDHSS